MVLDVEWIVVGVNRWQWVVMGVKLVVVGGSWSKIAGSGWECGWVLVDKNG